MKTGEPRLAIIDGVRTPFSKMGTDLASLSADSLGTAAVKALLVKTGVDPELVDEVIIGCVSQPAEAMNIARVIGLRSGLPEAIPAVTVHRNCASGFESLTSAYERLASGRGEVFVVGGTESMSQAPVLYSHDTARKFAALARARSLKVRLAALATFRPGDFKPVAGLRLGLTDPFSGLNMGETAEILARENGISREAQDQFALRSHQFSAAAREFLAGEIVPINVKGHSVQQDNGIREAQSLDALAKLKPVFDHTNGTVTAGNASQITDGAVALLVMSVERAEVLGLEPMGVLEGYAYTGCDPARMGLGPVSAIRRVNELAGRSLADADVVEINEAFAAQVLSVKSQLAEQGLGAITDEQLNPHGGAIALGHPVGATGARLILTSLRTLAKREGERALVSLCVGGGQGAALWLKRRPHHD